MPKSNTMARARKDKREGKSPSTQAGEFVREEIEDIRQGKHGARSTKQAIAIGLSKARRAGVDLPPPKRGTVSERTRRNAEHEYAAGRSGDHHAPNPKRSRATLRALRREGSSAASPESLSRNAREQARTRTPAERSASARKAARTRKRQKS
jgi:hypothetical protein